MKLAIFTLLHPGSLLYFQELLDSLICQSIKFDLWVAIDDLSLAELEKFNFGILKHHIIANPKNDNSALFRIKVLKEIADTADGIMIIDSDDYIINNRLEHVLEALENYDIHVSSLLLISHVREELGILNSIPININHHYNTIGLSHLALRSEVVKRFLLPPAGCLILDWYLAIQMSIFDVNIYYDERVGVAYRQHENNFFSCIPPYSSTQIRKATEYIMRQLSLYYSSIAELDNKSSIKILKRINELKVFSSLDDENLNQYLYFLNKEKHLFYWWEAIAYEPLKEKWLKS